MAPIPSGLSLFIHLGIIAIAWVFGLLGITRARKKENYDAELITTRDFARAVSVQVVAMLVLVVMGTLMTTFFFVAIQTGIREGASEPHRVFIKKTAGDVSDAIANIPGPFTFEASYEKENAVPNYVELSR
jgi:hypothetical protein